MPEYGFAVGMSKEEYEKDPVGVKASAQRMLKFNYKQFVDFVTEKDGECPFVGQPVRFIGPHPQSVLPALKNREDEVSFAWYVNTDVPEQYADLELLEVD